MDSIIIAALIGAGATILTTTIVIFSKKHKSKTQSNQNINHTRKSVVPGGNVNVVGSNVNVAGGDINIYNIIKSALGQDPKKNGFGEAMKASVSLGGLFTEGLYGNSLNEIMDIKHPPSSDKMKENIRIILNTYLDNLDEKAFSTNENDPEEIKAMKAGVAIGQLIAKTFLKGLIKEYIQKSVQKQDYRLLIKVMMDEDLNKLKLQIAKMEKEI